MSTPNAHDNTPYNIMKEQRYRIASLWLLLLVMMQAVAQQPAAIMADSDSLTADTTATSQPQLTWEEHIRQTLTGMVGESMFQTSQLGMIVWDLTTDSCLFSYNERQRLRPASTQKVVTAIAALDLLGADYIFTTSLSATGEVVDSTATLQGNIVCKGTMDPLFGNSDMNEFVNSVKQLGIKTISGRIVADASFKDTIRWGDGWCWDDDNPSLSPLLIERKDNFAETLRQRLQREGITVEGAAIAPQQQPRELCLRTRLLSEVLRPMMKRSDNLFAEAVFYSIAHRQGGSKASARHARNYIYQLMQRAGIDTTPVHAADGSGLSLYNYTTPLAELQLLRYAWKDGTIYDGLLPTLPIAGEDGTLQSRMKGTPAQGKVQAKTGTVTGVSALAGYLTAANGHRLCFSIMNQGITSAKVGRDFQDRVCAVLCR